MEVSLFAFIKYISSKIYYQSIVAVGRYYDISLWKIFKSE